jgi:hypothetical protein
MTSDDLPASVGFAQSRRTMFAPRDASLLAIVEDERIERDDDLSNEELLREFKNIIRNQVKYRENYDIDLLWASHHVNRNQIFGMKNLARPSHHSTLLSFESSSSIPFEYSEETPDSYHIALPIFTPESTSDTKNARFAVDGGGLGAALVTYAAAMLGLNVATSETFINPLIGITTLLAGLGFVIMKIFDKRAKVK